jgi:hypothetical protein
MDSVSFQRLDKCRIIADIDRWYVIQGRVHDGIKSQRFLRQGISV